VLVARHTLTPSKPDVSEYVNTIIQNRRESGEITTAAEEAQARAELTNEAIRRRFTAPAGGQAYFRFSGLDPGSESPVYVRAKPNMTNPDAQEIDDTCPGIWVFLQPRTDSDDTEMVIVGEMQQQLTAGAFQEVAVNPRVIDHNGMVHLFFQNLRRDTGIMFEVEDGIEVMQRVGGFAQNYYRSVIIIMANIILLSALSIMLGAMFSFPVASFCVGSVLFIGLLGPWVAEHALDLPRMPDMGGVQHVTYMLRNAIHVILRAILTILPQFGRFSPIDKVANGRLVSLGYTAQAYALLCFIQGGIAMLLAAYVYWRRELAKIIV